MILNGLKNCYITDGSVSDMASKIKLASTEKGNYRFEIKRLRIENVAEEVLKIYFKLNV